MGRIKANRKYRTKTEPWKNVPVTAHNPKPDKRKEEEDISSKKAQKKFERGLQELIGQRMASTFGNNRSQKKNKRTGRKARGILDVQYTPKTITVVENVKGPDGKIVPTKVKKQVPGSRKQIIHVHRPK